MNRAEFTQADADLTAKFDAIHGSLDKHGREISKIEVFIDRYIPVSIVHVVRGAIRSVFTREQLLRYNQWEMHKLH